MRLSEQFVVVAPVATVWSALIDVPAMFECVPGAHLEQQRADGRYDAGIGVDFGEVSLEFKGVVGFEFGDLTGVIRAEGRDKTGVVRAEGEMRLVVEDATSGTKVAIEADFRFSGILASVAEFGAKMTAGRLVRDFSNCLEARLVSG